MKKLVLLSIISASLILSSYAFADNKLLIKSGIDLSESNSFDQQDTSKQQNQDELNWKNDSRLSKNPVQKQQAKSSDEPRCYYVTSAVTNIRSTPSFLAERIGIYKYGNYICERSRIGDWINTGSGWVNIKLLSDKNPDVQQAAAPSETAPQTVSKPVAVKKPVTVPKAFIPEQTEDADVQQPANQITKSASQSKQAKADSQKAKDTTVYAFVSGDKVNIRKKPNKSARIVGLYRQNEKVTVIKQSGDWTKTDKGWVKNDFLTMSDSGSSKSKKADKKQPIDCQFVTSDKVNIRSSASRKSKDIGDYKQGDKVCFYEKTKKWGRTDQGWVNLDNFGDVKCYNVVADSLKVRSKPDDSSKLLKTIKRGAQVCDHGRKRGWVDSGDGWVNGVYLQ